MHIIFCSIFLSSLSVRLLWKALKSIKIFQEFVLARKKRNRLQQEGIKECKFVVTVFIVTCAYRESLSSRDYVHQRNLWLPHWLRSKTQNEANTQSNCSICSSLFPSWHIGSEGPCRFQCAYHIVVLGDCFHSLSDTA